MVTMVKGANDITYSPSLKLPTTVKDHAMYVSIVDADSSITALTVVLQATDSGWDVSDANANWYNLESYALSAGDLSAKKAYIASVNKPAKRVRCGISAITGAGAGDGVTIRYECAT